MKIERQVVLPKQGIQEALSLMACPDSVRGVRIGISQDECRVMLGMKLDSKSKTPMARYTQWHLDEQRVNKVWEFIWPWVSWGPNRHEN